MPVIAVTLVTMVTFRGVGILSLEKSSYLSNYGNVAPFYWPRLNLSAPMSVIPFWNRLDETIQMSVVMNFFTKFPWRKKFLMGLFSPTHAFSGGFWQISLKRSLYVKNWKKSFLRPLFRATFPLNTDLNSSSGTHLDPKSFSSIFNVDGPFQRYLPKTS